LCTHNTATAMMRAVMARQHPTVLTVPAYVARAIRWLDAHERELDEWATEWHADNNALVCHDAVVHRACTVTDVLLPLAMDLDDWYAGIDWNADTHEGA